MLDRSDVGDNTYSFHSTVIIVRSQKSMDTVEVLRISLWWTRRGRKVTLRAYGKGMQTLSTRRVTLNGSVNFPFKTGNVILPVWLNSGRLKQNLNCHHYIARPYIWHSLIYLETDQRKTICCSWSLLQNYCWITHISETANRKFVWFLLAVHGTRETKIEYNLFVWQPRTWRSR